MMKILLIFTLSLISGPVGCVDVPVIGYSGGSIIIISDRYWSSVNSNYICKVEMSKCTEIKKTNNGMDHVQLERFILFKNKGRLAVFIRKLKPQDAGTYRMGWGRSNYTDVSLKIVKDSCCVGTKIMNSDQGQQTNIICNYPAEYERNYKYFMKLGNDSIESILNTGTQSQKGRFSISDDRSAKVLSVHISDVREADEGVYYCGAADTVGSVQYYSDFTRIQLHVRATTTSIVTSAAPTEIPSDVATGSSNVIIISVCICVALLLIGGFTLMIYKLRHKRVQGSTRSSKDNEQVPSVYENVLANLPSWENLNTIMRLNHQTPESFTGQSDSAYQTLDPLTIQSDSDYTSLINTTEQLPMSSHYQCLNPRTLTNSVYHTLHS
ncbi:uncharacterized protein LOC132896273 [Neoarius graeffei]|uniref:uncharacterized protein LOC132896273 n=1 Tax=Neoarius graeffei TaxID=443677 RepID=UPI00298CB3D1|nr:uncharacterized protein LOC132896273 [Neoarius graeffei]